MINLVKGTSPEDPGTYSFRLNLTQLFPGAAARTFETALYVFERYILGWDPKKKRPLRFVYDLYVCNDHMCHVQTG